MSQVIESVKEQINSSVGNAISVFMMKELRRLYQEMLRNVDASGEIINNVNVTRLKEETLNKVLTLCKQRIGKFVLLTLDGQVGTAFLTLLRILSRAAKIITQ